MKKLLIVSALCVPVVAANAARSKLTQITCDNIEYQDMNWAAECNNGTETIVVTGVAGCGDRAAQKAYETADNITVGDDEDDAVNCYCRIADPFVSQWVFKHASVYAADCSGWCANFCANAIKGDAQFRTAIFTNIKGK